MKKNHNGQWKYKSKRGVVLFIYFTIDASSAVILTFTSDGEINLTAVVEIDLVQNCTSQILAENENGWVRYI